MDKPDKIIPANLEAEEAVLGSLLIDPDAIIKIAAFLKPDDYYREKNGWIYQAILELHERREPADFVTLVDELERRDQLQEVGGLAYITALVNSVPTAVHVEYYARIVERTATLRRLIGAAGQIAALAYEEAQDVDEVVDRAEQLIFGVSERRVRRDLTPVRQIMGDVVNRIEYLHSHKGEVLGVPTGFSRLDRLLGGFQKSDLIILAARPGVGKCIVSGSRLLDPETGRLVTIDEIVQRRRGNLLTLNGQAHLRPTQPSDFVDDGIKPVYRVRTALGREITTTASHPFLTVEGWQRLEHLAAGDGIAVPRSLPYFGTQQWPEEHVECLADLLNAGHPTPPAPGRPHEDPAGQADLTATLVAGPATRLDAPGETCPSALAGHPSQDTLTLGLRSPEPGLWGQDAQATRVPPVIFELTRPLVALFLRRLLAGAGRLCTAGGYGAPISYTTASYGLARDVQHLLLRFGILAELRHQPVRREGNCRRAYELAIRGRQDVGRSLAEIALSGGEGQLQERLAGAESDLYWDTIESIDYVGERQVYDLTVDGTHNFVAEDMLVHNTSLALNLAANAAKRFGQRVAFFSLEMSSEQLLQRLLSAETGINQQRLRLGDITEDEWLLLMEAASELSESLLFIDDTPAVSALELRTKARRLQAEHGLDMLIVDYLQLMRGDSRNDNRVQEISYITRSLKGLARELEVPLIALSQLSRAVEQRTDHKPVLSDLRESGCLAGQTLVTMADTGERVPIERLAGKTSFEVWALDPETLKLRRAMVSNAFCTGHKPVYRLTTQLGRTIRATANHRFRTIHGWQRLDELAPGVRIGLPRQVAAASSQTMSDDELALLGHLLGDGCTLPRHAIQYTTRENDLAQTVAALASRVFREEVEPRICAERQWFQVYLTSTRHHARGTHSAVTDWLTALGVWGLRSYEKRIPEAVFTQTQSGIATFLRHLWATDGCVRLRTGKAPGPAIYYATSSVGLARDVQSLLLRLGINARIKRLPQPGKGRDQYHVILSGKSDAVRFVQVIGAVGAYKTASLQQVADYLDGCIENTNRDILPKDFWAEYVRPAMRAHGITQRQLHASLGIAYAGMTIFGQNMSRERSRRVATAVQSAELERLAESDIYWDRVVSVEADGQEDVYDLTVPGPANFVADDIIVHNSIEQDADIVMFIYREDMVKEDTERKNVADVIVAKHRNGPTDTVPLYFDKTLTKFADLEMTHEPLEYGG